MKSLFILLACLLTSIAHAIDLQSAITERKLNCTIKSLGGHSGVCVLFELENLTNEVLNIDQAYGLELKNSNENNQDLILAEPLLAQLKPHTKYSIKANAFCITISKGAPQATQDLFSISAIAKPELLQQLNIINKAKWFNYSGQGAIWAMQGSTAPDNIEGVDSATVMALQKNVCSFYKMPVPAYSASKYITRRSDTTRELSIRNRGNMFVENLKASDKIDIAVYTASDSVVYKKELVAQKVDKDFSELKWQLELDKLDPRKVYYMRIKINGVVRKERVWDFFV
jgi:hypothetical protein